MTDIIEKIQTAISSAVSETQSGLFTVVIDRHAQARAALFIIKEDYQLIPKDKPESIVKELVWRNIDRPSLDWEAHTEFCTYTVWERNGIGFWSDNGSIGHQVGGSATVAQAAAQDHYTARVISMLKLEESE
ncbi:hypothetical protein [uncultured Cohaesibacter sp.]|uniref:hypothetical protein n=1 Tax=uncultured Cohaesibacter sp. TaxID=1002546 RepID=UPI00292D5C2F|nr:hypothetical protein [uncultured Cohaesibacter sp.]